MKVDKKVVKYLLKTEAVKLSPEKPFIWSSGWNSPIYCDNRITLSSPKARTFIKNKLAKLILKKFPKVDLIAGVATAGIAQGALVADKLELPFAYVRPKPKEHGMGNQIEGKIDKKQKIVVLEDLISTGGSSINAVEALKKEGYEVLGLVAIFTYGFEIANENFEKAGIEWFALSNYEILIKEALKANYIANDDVESLEKWRIAPDTWKA